MQTLRIKSELLPAFVESLKHWGTLWAPVERGQGTFSLEPIQDIRKARPEAIRTLIPFKKLLLPPRFAMMEARGNSPPIHAGVAGSQVFYGAHPCDIHALRILDLLFLSDFEDPYYKSSRERLTVVGYGCLPDEHCFCGSMATSTADDGFDLFLTPLEGRLLATVASARGDELVRHCGGLFEPATKQDVRDYVERRKEREHSFTLHLDTTDLPYLLELRKEDPMWEELAKKCLCCGTCSMVCPTCTCFNVADEIPEVERAARVRTWDSCLYRDYAVVAGGHSFRSTRADRVKNRYYHKQEAFVREFGLPACVGCGRCIDNCPTGIDAVEVLRHVRGEA